MGYYSVVWALYLTIDTTIYSKAQVMTLLQARVICRDVRSKPKAEIQSGWEIRCWPTFPLLSNTHHLQPQSLISLWQSDSAHSLKC